LMGIPVFNHTHKSKLADVNRLGIAIAQYWWIPGFGLCS